MRKETLDNLSTAAWVIGVSACIMYVLLIWLQRPYDPPGNNPRSFDPLDPDSGGFVIIDIDKLARQWREEREKETA